MTLSAVAEASLDGQAEFIAVANTNQLMEASLQGVGLTSADIIGQNRNITVTGYLVGPRMTGELNDLRFSGELLEARYSGWIEEEMRILEVGSLEYLDGVIKANVPLDSQPVEVSIDGKQTWISAQWVGDIGTTRSLQAEVNELNMPDPGVYKVYVRVTDNSESPIFAIGSIEVVS